MGPINVITDFYNLFSGYRITSTTKIGDLLTSVSAAWDCCPEGTCQDNSGCSQIFGLTSLVNRVGSNTMIGQLSGQDIVDWYYTPARTYGTNLVESKNGFLTDLNPTNTADYTNTPLEINEETKYFKFTNVYESGISVPPTYWDINYYTSGSIGTRIIPLMQLTSANFYKIEKIETIFKFFSVEGGTPLVPPSFQLLVVKDNNDGSGLSQVGTAVKAFDTTSPITVGGLKEYRYKFVIPQAFYNLVTVNKTFPTDGVGSITDWSTFVNTISGNITNSNEVYYFALTVETPSTSGKGWFEFEFTAEMSSAPSCVDCDTDNKVNIVGDCFTCESKPTDSNYWVI